MRKLAVCICAGMLAQMIAGAAAPPSGKSAAPVYNWRNVEIGGGGYVLDVVCHPKVKDLVYIRTDVGGFYRWDAVQTRWIPLTDRFRRDQSNFYGGEALAIDPGNPEVVYIAAGKYSASWAPAGAIFKSADRGRTWKKLPIELKMGGNEDHREAGPRLAVSPAHSAVILFGSRRDGLWRSVDSGASWSRVSAFPARLADGVGITSVAFSEKTPGLVYAAAYGDGVYESRDDGLTWRRTDEGPDRVVRLAVAGSVLYATHAKGVARYAQERWSSITPPQATGAVGGLAVDPRDPRDLLVTTQQNFLQMYRSRDGGATWTDKKSTVRSSAPWYSSYMKQIQYVSGLAFDPCVPGRVWLTDWYATYHTDNIDADPAILRNEEHGHEELVAFTLAAPPGGPALLTGVADVDGFTHDSLDAFPTHGFGDAYGGTGPSFGDTYQIAWCPSAPERIVRVGGKRWDNTGTGTLSRDGGRTWSAFASWDWKIVPARVAVSAADPNNMVVLRQGNGPARVTQDGGASWRDVAGLPTDFIGNPWVWIVPLASDGSKGGVFYAYHGGTLYRSTDGGATFAAFDTGLPNEFGCLLQCELGRQGALWLALSDHGLYHSTDGGETFTAVAAVRRAPLFACGKAAPGASSATLYLYGDLADGRSGIFRSLNSGVSWEEIDDPAEPVGDEPNCMAASFRTFGLLFIGTNGRGVYSGAPRQAAGNSH